MIDDLLLKIDSNFTSAFGPSMDISASALEGPKPLDKLTHGKLFEISALSELVVRLKRTAPSCTFELMHNSIEGNKLVLQSAPGKADPSRSYIRVVKHGSPVATIWTNVEFEGISGQNSPAAIKSGSYHEADILILKDISISKAIRPKYKDVLLVIECKLLTSLPKVVLRNLLGLRREMSYLNKPQASALLTQLDVTKHLEFRQCLRAEPASHLIFYYPDHYKFDPSSEWADPGSMFGVEFWPH